MDFETYPVRARKDLIQFIEENIQFVEGNKIKDLPELIGEEPEKWVDELNIINNLLNRESLSAGIGIHQPPKEDPEFRQIGPNVFLYRGKERKLAGLWISEETTRPDFKCGKIDNIPHTQWTHYRLSDYGILKINQEFSDVPCETFLPENFEPKSIMLENTKRPVMTFGINNEGKEMQVFAKGADLRISLYYSYSKPGYRLTSISGIQKTTSEEEMQRHIKLSERGIKTPKIIGYYETPFEEFLFLKKVEGSNPSEYFDSHRETIIEQDAQMLATLCLLGCRKAGFADPEDKIFDGTDLCLIDVDELRDLYFATGYDSPEFREVLLDSSNRRPLREFRRVQGGIFEKMLKDAIFSYRESLTPDFDSKALYVKAFFDRVGWKEPKESRIRKLTSFPDDYHTLDSYFFLMNDI